jgi:hypothetical protein
MHRLHSRRIDDRMEHPLYTVSRPFSRRLALRISQAVGIWALRNVPRRPSYSERVARIEASREAAARVLPQLPRIQ